MKPLEPTGPYTAGVSVLPRIIQGGMGVGVSGWGLAQAVSKLGQLGVVSGVALAVLMVRRLQMGDVGGHIQRALLSFPLRDVAAQIIEKYYIVGGKSAAEPFKLTTFPALRMGRELLDLTVAGNFVEIFLAKEGHSGLVGVNYLEKLQLMTLPSVYGAMLAGVDYILVGAGVPRAIPGVMDRFAAGEAADLHVDAADMPPGEVFSYRFDPAEFWRGPAPKLMRPAFLAIISSATLATALARKSSGHVDGFVVEGNVAGGHNAPPRGVERLNDRGEPQYGELDVPDLQRIKALGLPFWLAGSYADPEKLIEAEGLGAAGIQVGTAFAFCAESNLTPELKQQVMDMALAGTANVLTDRKASPTGFPFKVVQMAGTLSDPEVYGCRERRCDSGYMRSNYRKSDGTIGYRCPAEPVEDYVRKGGDVADTAGRKCLCNGLVASIGLGQVQPNGQPEPPLLTAGDDVARLARFLVPGRAYTAADVIRYLLGPEEKVAAPALAVAAVAGV